MAGIFIHLQFDVLCMGNVIGLHRQEKENMGGETIRMIQRDYPKALDNGLHRFFNRIEV